MFIVMYAQPINYGITKIDFGRCTQKRFDGASLPQHAAH